MDAFKQASNAICSMTIDQVYSLAYKKFSFVLSLLKIKQDHTTEHNQQCWSKQKQT